MRFIGDTLPLERLNGMPIACVGNLECALVDGDFKSDKAYTSILPLSCAANIANSRFSALSLANNHLYDAGSEAVVKMKGLLTSVCAGVQFFGTIDMPYAILESDGKKVAVIGSLENCRSRGELIFKEEDVEKLIHDIEGKFDAVYAYPHWGKEGEYTRWPSPRQRKLAQRWIDAGADGVFGSHSHVFQGKEVYKGKPIYYSLGNFFFPHPENKLYSGTDTGLTVEISPATNKVVEKFVKSGTEITEEDELVALRSTFEDISLPLKGWTTWKWAKLIGPFNLKKNNASWSIRLKNNFIRTLPKFLAWQFLPKTLLFRVASFVVK